MKPHTYTFKYREPNGSINCGTVEATSKECAYRATMADTRLKGCTVKKASFRRADTAKGANRAGGLDSNGKQRNARTVRQGIESQAYKDFLKHLDLAIENLYLCHMENNAAVLSMPIKQLYEDMKDFDPFK